ncbi:ArsR/SmtB family transcription factor [Haladaptatus sp. GCM10025707]|uniref:ArsR/SmtB family transcription factor n=1 Tax=unclassified Haladaptatus TaxID=2622732 RepID=UPI0023E8A051|nr:MULTISPECIES: winged helix-turn-helix domain-containing protein [unclassified Haladaptatus]
MARLLPLRADPEVAPGDPRLVDVDSEAADEVFEALSSRTARRILAVLYESPRTPTEIREEVGTSLQNVHYHLDKLQSAGLITAAGTGYSEKGKEMTVFAPTSESVVLFAGDERQQSLLRGVLTRLVGAIVLLAGATLGLQYALANFFAQSAGGPSADASSGGADGAMAAQETTQVAAESAAQSAPFLDPALAFFLGGSFIILLAISWWAYQQA